MENTKKNKFVVLLTFFLSLVLVFGYVVMALSLNSQKQVKATADHTMGEAVHEVEFLETVNKGDELDPYYADYYVDLVDARLKYEVWTNDDINYFASCEGNGSVSGKIEIPKYVTFNDGVSDRVCEVSGCTLNPSLLTDIIIPATVELSYFDDCEFYSVDEINVYVIGEITHEYYYSNFIGYDNWEDMGNCLGYWAYAVKKTNIYLSQANLTRAQNMTVWVDEALGGGIGWGTNPSLVVDYIGEFDHAEEDEFFEAVCVRIIYFHEFIDGYSVDPSTICDGDVRWYTDGGDYGIEFKLLPTNEVLYENFYESDSHHNLESAGVVAEVIVPTAIIVLGIAAFVVVSKKKEQF